MLSALKITAGAVAVGFGVQHAFIFTHVIDTTKKCVPVEQGKTRIAMIGSPMCKETAHAHILAYKISQHHEYQKKFDTFFAFGFYNWKYAAQITKEVTFPESLKGFSGSPYVWLETLELQQGSEKNSPNSNSSKSADVKHVPIGGDSDFCSWVLSNDSGITDPEILEYAKNKNAVSWFSAYHIGLFNAGEMTAKFVASDDDVQKKK